NGARRSTSTAGPIPTGRWKPTPSPSSSKVRCAIGADDAGPLTDALLAELNRRGAAIERFGALLAPGDAEWASIGRAVGAEVAAGRAEVGIVCCWTGTGISIAANKVHGVRAALCGDAATAEGRRRRHGGNGAG